VRILGIDPGLATTGYGVIDGERALTFGVVVTPAGEALERRLLQLHQRLDALIAEFEPEACAAEELFFGKNSRSAFAVAQARGVALLAAAQHGLAVEVYRPIQVKQAVAAYGGATKQQVQQMVRMLLGLSEVPRPDDAADALAIALCHEHSHEALARRRAAEARVSGLGSRVWGPGFGSGVSGLGSGVGDWAVTTSKTLNDGPAGTMAALRGDPRPETRDPRPEDPRS